MNVITIKGNLVKPMELKKSKDGKTVFATGTIAENHKDKTNFFNFTIFGKQAEFATKTATKGSRILVSGKFKSSKYEKDGNTLTSWNIVANVFENFETKETNSVSEERTRTPKADAPAKQKDEMEAFFDGAETSDEEFPF